MKSATKTTKTSAQSEGDTSKKTVTSAADVSLDTGTMEYDHEYKSSIQARPTYSRTSGSSMTSPSVSGGRTLKIVTEYGSSQMTGMSPAFSQTAATAILESREREKKEMMDLNDRLASYIEKVRFLEAQNRKLAGDLETLRGRWGKDTSSIRQMYEGELMEARRLIDETAKAKSGAEGQINKLQEELAEYRRKDDLSNQASPIDFDFGQLEAYRAAAQQPPPDWNVNEFAQYFVNNDFTSI